jgi:16S rRNA (guanine527-N7)-methyltransferase
VRGRASGGADDRQRWDDLIPHLLRAGAKAEESLSRIRRFGEMLLLWNRRVSNLISRNDEPRLVARHLAESLEPAHWLKESDAKKWLDLGAGGGLPAIPLAIAGVGSSWTLVESRRTKTLFMRKVIEDIELKNVSVVLARLEDVADAPPHVGAYDGFTSRATLTLGPTLALAAKVVRSGGTAFLWKGSRREEEMAKDPFWREAWEHEGLLGIGTGQTVVARFRRK